MKIPTQAAILCGGLGERLRPLTEMIPKPMVPINGRPFLAFLIEQLRGQGVNRFVLMTGYLNEKIRDYFRDGHSMGVEIEYSNGPVHWDTGRRIWEARSRLDERFMVLYSDNYVPFNLERLASLHDARQATITLLVSSKTPGNIRLDSVGNVVLYEPARSTALSSIEIGYMVAEREALFEAFDVPDVNFSSILRKLSLSGKLAAVSVTDAYHSIGDIERMRLTERYMTPRRVLLIDRDGTINQKAPRGEYISKWEDFRWIEENVSAMEELAEAGFKFIVLSNQAGIGRGMVEAEAVDGINRQMVLMLEDRGIEVLDVYVCPHHWEDNCTCRKPATGLFDRASRDHFVRLDRTIYIGDDYRDAQAANNARCLSILIGCNSDSDAVILTTPTRTASNLKSLVPWIIAQFDLWEQSQQDARHPLTLSGE